MCSLFGLVLVGFMQVGPDTYQVEILDQDGEIIEFTLIKNDKNV